MVNVQEMFGNFIRQSQYVLEVTHKPKDFEYRQMALTTAIGIAIIGLIGLVITVIAHVLRTGRL